MKDQKSTHENQKNRTLSGHSDRTPGKDSVTYWKARLKQRKGGGGKTVPSWQVRLTYLGKEAWFNLHTENRDAAASKARERYRFLIANGWESTLAEFKPKARKPERVATVGELIEAAAKVSPANPKSVRQYGVKLRLIAAEIAKVKAGKERYGYQKEAFTKWRSKVDALPLSLLTGDNVAKWRAERIAVENDPIKRQAAKVSADSTIRQAKALLGKKLLPFIANELQLPTPLPFTGISLGKTTRRFRSEVSPLWLFSVAKAELAGAQNEKLPERRDRRGRLLPKPDINPGQAKREQWKAFALLMLAGLRRAEADTLTWKQIDLENAQLRVERTAYFSPKTPEAERLIDLSSDAVDIFRRFKSQGKQNALFVLHGGEARPASKREYYRADSAPWRTWEGLTAWLREKGVNAPKPLHALRAMAGGLINEGFGLEAARDFLGHADIKTTSASYMPRRPKVAVSFNLPETDFAAETRETGQ